jgi:hypothetical protein
MRVLLVCWFFIFSVCSESPQSVEIPDFESVELSPIVAQEETQPPQLVPVWNPQQDVAVRHRRCYVLTGVFALFTAAAAILVGIIFLLIKTFG